MQIFKAKITDFSQEEYDRAFNIMSEDRKKAVLRKKIDDDRKRSVLGEYLARKAISEHCGVPESEINFGRTESGKPFAKNVGIEFGISHSKDLAVCAVSEKPLGIDCELIREIDLRITNIACTESDKEFIFEAEDKEEKNLRFFKVWTAKEAYFKYIGTGITSLKSVSYKDIEQYCEMHIDGEYMITVYGEKIKGQA